MKELTKQNIIDILYGCTVLGTGGGGNLEEGLEMMEQDFKEEKKLNLAVLEELPDNAYIATPYCCGAPASLEELEKEETINSAEESIAIKAFKGLETYLKNDFFAVSSTELGGANTAEALHIACQLGIPIMDADPVGRSVPELQHSTYYVKNKSISPLTVATSQGDVLILKETQSDFRAEEIVRAIAVVSGSLVGVTDHPMTGKDYKEAIIPGAISYAMNIGKVLRENKEQGKTGYEVACDIANKFHGKIAFRGDVESAPWEKTGGFNIGEINIKGKEENIGESYKIWFKNENLMAYHNGKVDVTTPDLICMIGADGNPLTNPNFEIGMEINVLILPAAPIWRTKEGLECLGPKYFGFDLDYIPFEEIK